MLGIKFEAAVNTATQRGEIVHVTLFDQSGNVNEERTGLHVLHCGKLIDGPFNGADANSDATFALRRFRLGFAPVAKVGVPEQDAISA